MELNDLKATLGAWFFEIMSFLVSGLPLPWRLAFAKWLGTLFSYLPSTLKKGIERNLNVLDMNLGNRRRMVQQIFENFALTLNDFFFPGPVTLEVENRTELDALRHRHKGILFLTFHMGNWELGARTMAEWGWPVSAVYQPYQNQKFKDVIEKRRAKGVNFIPVGGQAARGVREALRRGDVVAMLGDHPFGEEGMPVKLFGHTVMWPKGPVLLAVRENVPIVVAVIVRVGPCRYKALVESPLIPKERTRGEVERLVQEVANTFGKFVSLYPTQWFRFREFEFVPTTGQPESIPQEQLVLKR